MVGVPRWNPLPSAGCRQTLSLTVAEKAMMELNFTAAAESRKLPLVNLSFLLKTFPDNRKSAFQIDWNIYTVNQLVKNWYIWWTYRRDAVDVKRDKNRTQFYHTSERNEIALQYW